MKPKQLLILGTMAVAITVGGGIWNKEANAETSLFPTEPSCGASSTKETGQDPLLQKLGLSSPEQMYDALYNGQSLADIAAANAMEVQPIIDLQLAELSAQLDARLAAGHITPSVYEAQKGELPEIISRSVYGGQAQP
ncbi:hypothetical protein [Paenibacillus sp. HJGM_3]|uniref:hypothetical protein n=1 Tax=Paenibacillus sp. HJGM_3 TaxID=3379816 RepID=UPI00385AE50C